MSEEWVDSVMELLAEIIATVYSNEKEENREYKRK